jgi:hypothetical protein
MQSLQCVSPAQQHSPLALRSPLVLMNKLADPVNELQQQLLGRLEETLSKAN